MNGEFLNKTFRLTKTSAAENAEGSSREDKVNNYLSRIEDIVKNQKGLRHLKERYINKALVDISEDRLEKLAIGLYESEKQQAINEGRGGDIPDNLTEDLLIKYKEEIERKEKIQRESLERIFDYVVNNENGHPNWFRYFILRSVLGMGTLEADNKRYTNRTDTTIAPFLDLNHEIVGKVRQILEKQLTSEGIQLSQDEIDLSKKEKNQKRFRRQVLSQKKDYSKREIFSELDLELDDDLEVELLAKMEHKSFSELYAFLETSVAKVEVLGTDGKWIKFDQNSNPQILEETLRNKDTGWCTATGSAPEHLRGGDFYVYYTYTKEELEEKENDSDVEPTQPMIAIRMLNGMVYEVRGVEANQNVTPEFLNIAAEKYNTLPGGDKFKKKKEDMDRLTGIYSKFKKDEGGNLQYTDVDLNEDEISFLYELEGRRIEGFGNQKDKRIKEILNLRENMRDLEKVYGVGAVAISKSEITGDTRYYVGDLGVRDVDILRNIVKEPFSIGGHLSLDSLTSAEGLNLPQSIGGHLSLDSLTSAEGLNLPQSVGRNLYLKSLTSDEKQKLIARYPQYGEKII